MVEIPQYWAILERLPNNKVRAKCGKCQVEYIRGRNLIGRSTQCINCLRKEQRSYRNFNPALK